MWNYLIEKHGRKEFNAVYKIVSKFKDLRFSDEAQNVIAELVNDELVPLGMTNHA
jgi:hypothetical protein